MPNKVNTQDRSSMITLQCEEVDAQCVDC